MKCIVKLCSLFCSIILMISFVGCGKKAEQTSYDIRENSYQYGIIHTQSASSQTYLGDSLCIPLKDNFGLEQVDSQVCGGAGVFNLSKKECTYAQNIYNQMYPASTTKILTCYVALKYGDLSQTVTVSDYAADQTPDSSVANLKAGDILTLEDLLYGLMLRSGNDAAISIAEAISGSEEKFSDLMNQEALRIGATHSHFITPHGLHKNEHYTTIYDMYLIFSEAIKDPMFLKIISTQQYDVTYSNIDGSSKEQSWTNSNQYLNGGKKPPYGFQVIGGKTGTTYEAGYCLVLLSKNEQNEDIISIVYNSDCTLNLYYLMNELLYTFGEP